MSDIAFRMGADPSGLTSGLAAAQAAVRAAAARMSSAFRPVQTSIGEAQAGLQRFNGVLGGLSVAAFAASVRSSIREIDALNDAADRTGATIEELSSLQNTLAPYGTGIGDIEAATSRLVKAMTNADDEAKGAGEAFGLLGIKVRDANGNLRPSTDVLYDVARALNQYQDGTNKTALAVAIFGKQGAALLPMLKDLATAQREAATITTAQAEAAEKAEQALARIGNEFRNMRLEAANNLIPTLNDLLGKLRSIATISENPIEWARFLFGSGSNIDAEIRRVEADIARLNGVVAGGGNNAGGANTRDGAGGSGLLGTWFRGAFGDPNSARIELGRLQAELVKLNAIRDAQRKLGVSTVSRERQPFSDARDGRTRGAAPALSVKDPAAEAAAKALAARQEAAINAIEQQVAKEQQLSEVERMRLRTTTGDYRAFSAAVKERLMLAAAEIDRANLLDQVQKQANDDELEDIRALDALKKQALADLKQQNAELDAAAEKWKDIVDPTREYTRKLGEIRRLVETGRMTRDQGLDAEFNLESARQDAIDKGLKVEEPAWLSTVEGGFRRLFDSIKEGSITAGGVMRGAFQLAGDIVTNVLSKMATEWVANLLIGKITAIKAAFSDISASAARAGAGAFAATAAIPFVGPALAPAAGAAAYAGAMSYASGLAVASAARGFDIPANLNPMTQLHAREMVLPADIAEPMRAQLRGGGGMGGPRVSIHAMDGKSVERTLLDNPRALARSLRTLQRNGAR